MMQKNNYPAGHLSLPAPVIIDTLDGLDRLQRALRRVGRLALDTESNSLHAYRARVCLIQISTDSADYLVDPLALDESRLDFLGAVCADPSVEKVLHAAEYDVMMLNHDFGFTFANVFDTMIAARVLGWEQLGLGAILSKRYSVEVDKRHQRADWGRRPLPTSLIRYAQQDTHFLLRLRDEQFSLLEAGHHLEEARELFDGICQARWNGPDFDPEGYWRISGARDLSPRSLAVLRELYLYREQQAKRQDIPVFKVMGDKTLLALAKDKPCSLRHLRRVRGMSDGQMRRYGVGILKAIKSGMGAVPPTPPRRSVRAVDEATLRRYDALRTWRKERALEKGVESDVVMSKDALWEIAKSPPKSLQELEAIDYLGPWRLRTYGEEILRVLAEVEEES